MPLPLIFQQVFWNVAKVSVYLAANDGMFTILWITLSWTALLHAVYMHQIDMLFNFKSVDQINYNPYLQTMISRFCRLQ